MNISYNWLKNYLDLNLSSEEISQLLTDIGLEVEGVKLIESVKGGLKGVIIGEVITKTQHPNADRLSLTMIDVGEDHLIQIVCGAPNINVGQKVPIATVGTWLYDGDNKFKIKKGKIRGEESTGMVCGEDELGLGEDTNGIMVLDSAAKVGIPASEYFKLESDIVFEIGLTPNRSDAMGHIGVARDLLTILNHKGSKLQMCKPSTKDFKLDNRDKNIEVEVEDHKICPRYSGLSISGIKVATSPNWLQNKLKAIGITPTNNVVDITNYVLHEIGQPLHAFDSNKIEGNKIVVSCVKEKTKFITLDEIERELSSADLMISDAKKPLCIAGVFGGIESSVTDSTTEIFLESAYFNSVSIRKSAKRHNLNTDASFRFERGCDPNNTVYALKRAALLIIEICGGKISSEVIDIYPNPIAHFPVELTYTKMDSLIGEKIDRQVIKNILNDLEIEISTEKIEGLSLLVPPFRADVKREVDVIEEILRIYGYNTISIPLKLNTNISHSNDVNAEQIRNVISDLLSSTGFNEAMNNSLTKEAFTDLIPDLSKEQNITLLNPLSQDLNVMRQSLLFSGLENIAYNQNRKNADIKFYEFGKTYHKTNKGNIEDQHLQILVSGRIQAENWNTNDDNADFYFIKEKVEHILNRLGIKKVNSETLNTYGFDDGLIYTFKKKRLVSFGRLNAKLVKSFGVKSTIYAADFNWDLMLELAGYTKIKYREVSKFPKVRRDLSLLVNKSVSFDELKKIAIATDNKILKLVNLFDVYEGDKLPEDKKSYALSFIMADDTKTLTDIYVDKVMEELMKSFTDKAGAEIR